jgi:ATP-dependent Clp protease adaptor protein ClpS
MDFVVMILSEIFDKDYEEAVRLMMSVHHGMYAVVGVYTKNIAYTKANQATEAARRQGYPLKIEVVEE